MRAAITFVFLTSFALLSRVTAQPAAPDVVETIHGDFYRGTIVESVVGDHVTIILPSGASITVAWSELTRADRNVGQQSPAPTPVPTPPPAYVPAPPAVPSRPSGDREPAIGPYGQPVAPGVRTVSVRVRAANPRQTLQLLVGHDSFSVPMVSTVRGQMVSNNLIVSTPVFQPLCTGNCALELAVGLTYQLNVDPGDGSGGMHTPRSRSVRITDRTVGLAVDYRSRRAQRRRRWIAIAAVPVVGAMLMAFAGRSGERWCEDHPDACDFETRNQAMFWSGVTLVCTPVLTFMLPLFTRDRAVIDLIEVGSY
jgi:hypothetical protein